MFLCGSHAGNQRNTLNSLRQLPFPNYTYSFRGGCANLLAMKKPRGRPKFEDPYKVRRVMFCIRLRAEDRKLFEEAAAISGQTARAWVREWALKEAQRVVDTKALEDVGDF